MCPQFEFTKPYCLKLCLYATETAFLRGGNSVALLQCFQQLNSNETLIILNSVVVAWNFSWTFLGYYFELKSFFYFHFMKKVNEESLYTY